MLGDHLGWDQVSEDELSVLALSGNAHRVREFKLLFGAGVVFVQEVDHTEIVLEGNLVRFRECFEGRHVARSRFKGFQDGLAEGDAVQAEVRLEEEIGHVVERPFAGLIQGCTVRKTDLP
jgi:hypothetical protein